MRIVGTLLVRDEEDIVGEHLRYHLEQGIVDFVIATDHRSVDGTTDILREHERQGHLHLIREERPEYVQPEYVTRMARLAATDFGADWVINMDADEFWWPREGTLHETLAAVPARFGVVVGLWRHFVLRPDDDRPFYERMLWRRRPSLEPTSPYHSALKVAHRAVPDVRVMGGNHKAFGEGLTLLREWMPIEVLHFPIRTRRHLERKFGRSDLKVRPGRHWVRASDRLEREGAESVYSSLLMDDRALVAGIAEGDLTEDTRLRDTLCGDRRVTDVLPSLEEDVAFAVEAATFHPGDSYLRLSWRAGAMKARLAALEAALASRHARPAGAAQGSTRPSRIA